MLAGVRDAMSRLSGWAVAGILAAMLIGTIHAFAEAQLARTPRLYPSGWFR